MKSLYDLKRELHVCNQVLQAHLIMITFKPLGLGSLLQQLGDKIVALLAVYVDDLLGVDLGCAIWAVSPGVPVTQCLDANGFLLVTDSRRCGFESQCQKRHCF